MVRLTPRRLGVWLVRFLDVLGLTVAAAAAPGLSVAASQTPRVPPTAPDTVPAWVYAPANLATDTGASYDYYADVIIISFSVTATQSDRQAAIDSIHGLVVGGQPMPPGEGFYYVRLEAGRRLEPLTTAVTRLWSLPQVASASLVTRLEEQFRRPNDQGDSPCGSAVQEGP